MGSGQWAVGSGLWRTMWRSLAEKEEEGWVAKTRGTRVRENVVVITRKDVKGQEASRFTKREDGLEFVFSVHILWT